MAIFIATEADYKGIRTIWEERFTTEGEYLEVMFSRIMPLCTSYIYKNEDGEILAVASFMPMKFIDSIQNNVMYGWYMFGVATLVKAEGKRLAASTISYAIDDISTKNYQFIFERPANQQLNNYYLKLGFSKTLKRAPFAFSSRKDQCSSGNTAESCNQKTLPEYILEQIEMNFERRFIWENPEILQALIDLGELESHPIEVPDETYIALNPLNGTSTDSFNNAFFCFPME